MGTLGHVTVLETRSRGDEARCVRDALAAGATTMVVLGGDGTVSRAAAELVREQSRVPLAVLSAGTGNDFAKSIGAPAGDFVATARLIASGRVRSVDAGRVDDCIFVNAAGFGFDAETLAHTEQARWPTGRSVYAAAAVAQLFRYRGFRARVSAGTPAAEITGPDDAAHDRNRPRWLTIVFANGGWFGGAFRIAPGARINDGLLDAVLIGNAAPSRRSLIFLRALLGWHVGLREVRVQQSQRFTLEFARPPRYQADGELRLAATATVVIESLPSVLQIVGQG